MRDFFFSLIPRPDRRHPPNAALSLARSGRDFPSEVGP